MAAFLVIVVLGEGYDFGVLNGAIVRIKEELQCSTMEISMVVAATPISFLPGALFGGMIADHFGRKKALAGACVLLFLGPFGMATSSSIGLLMAFRGFVGAGTAVGMVVVSMYLAEIAPTHLRGTMTGLEDVALNVGTLLGYMANWALLGISNDWRWMIGLGSVPPLLALGALCMPLTPESPRWLFAQGREAEAEEVLVSLVGERDGKLSLAAMVAERQEKRAVSKLGDKEDNEEAEGTWAGAAAAVAKGGPVRCMFMAGIMVAIAQASCGVLPLSYYSSIVLSESMGQKLAFAATVAMGTAKLTVDALVVAFVERVGRRPMLLLSLAMTTFASTFLMIVFALDAPSWVKAAGFCLFMAGFSVGLGPVSFIYMPEVFTTEWRGKGVSSALLISRLMGATTIICFPLFIDLFGAAPAFGLQAAWGVVLTWLVWLLAHETRGYALEDMISVCSRAASSPSSGASP